MRVLLLSNHLPDGSQTDPLARLVGQRAAALAALGVAVRVSPCPPRFPIWKPLHGSRWSRAALRSIDRLRIEFDFDLIEAHGVLPAGVTATRLARELGVPCVLYALGPELDLPLRRAALRPQVAAALAVAQALLAPGAASAETLFRLGGDRHKIHVVPDGIDPCFRFREPREARQMLGLPPDEILLLATGDAVGSSGDLLLEAVARMRSTGVPARLHVLGEVRQGKHRLSRIAKLGLGEAVVLHGEMDPARQGLWYQAATLQLAAWGGAIWSYPLHAARACGLPLVTTAADEVEEVVCDATGVAVEGRTSDAIADAIRTALARKWDRRAIAAHAPRHRWPEMAARRLCILRMAALAHAPRVPSLQPQTA